VKVWRCDGSKLLPGGIQLQVFSVFGLRKSREFGDDADVLSTAQWTARRRRGETNMKLHPCVTIWIYCRNCTTVTHFWHNMALQYRIPELFFPSFFFFSLSVSLFLIFFLLRRCFGLHFHVAAFRLIGINRSRYIGVCRLFNLNSQEKFKFLSRCVHLGGSEVRKGLLPSLDSRGSWRHVLHLNLLARRVCSCRHYPLSRAELSNTRCPADVPSSQPPPVHTCGVSKWECK
jgi:hypothetical protein